MTAPQRHREQSVGIGINLVLVGGLVLAVTAWCGPGK